MTWTRSVLCAEERTDTTTSYTYDADHSLTVVTQGGSVVAAFTYDAAERIANLG